MNKMKCCFYLIKKYPYNELANLLGKFSFMRLYFKYYDYVLDLKDNDNIDEFLKILSVTNGTKEEKFLEAAKKDITFNTDEFWYQKYISYLHLKRIKLNDFKCVDNFDKRSVFPQSIERLFYIFGRENILKFDNETGFFSKCSVSKTTLFHKTTMNLVRFASLVEMLNLHYDVNSYEEFLVSFCDALKTMKDNGSVFDISYLKEKLNVIEPELFIDSKASSALKELFYKNKLRSKEIFNHEEYIPYLVNKDLNKLFSCLIKVKIKDKTFDLVDLVSKEKYLEILSKYLITEELTINLTKKEEIINAEYLIREKLYEMGNNIDYLFLRREFLRDHPEVKISTDDKKIRKVLNKRRLTLEDVRINSNIGVALKGKDLVRLFNLNEYLEDLLKVGGEDLFIKLIQRYGGSLYLIDKYFEINDNLIQEIDNYLIDKYRSGIIFEPYHVPKFIKEKCPDLFLDEDAPEELKRYFYGIDKELTFRILSKNKNWVKYLKGKNVLMMFIKSGYFKDEDLYTYYFNLFKEDSLKVGLFNSELIDSIIYEKEEVDLVYEWFLASGKKFIPSEVVLENMDVSEALKFFKYAKWWSKLTRIKRYSDNYDTLDGLFKLAYVFGVFDGNINGFNTLYNMLTNLPKEFTLMNPNCSEINEFIFDSQKDNFNRACEEERFSLDFIKRDGNTYKVLVNSEMYPKSLSIIRECIEIYTSNLLNPLRVHRYFSNFEPVYDEDFLKFFLDNYDKVFKTKIDAISRIQKNFNGIKHLNSGRKLTWDMAIDYIKKVTYDNVELGNEYMASVVSQAGCTNDEFRELQCIYNEGKYRVFSSIPKVTGSLGDFTYEMLNLDDPLALVVGTFTDCCQCIGNVAESCMVHSMTSENGRIFVVRDSDGEIVAQSWVWRNRNVICFDNIEIPDKMFSKYENLGEQVLLAYQDASHKLINIDYVAFTKLYEENKITKEQYDKLKLRKVTVGPGYDDIKDEIVKNLKKDMGITAVPLEKEKNLNLHTCDSDEQYVLYTLDNDILSNEFSNDINRFIKYFAYINNEQCSSLDNLVIYHDPYNIYNENNFDYEMFKILKSLEIIRDNENVIFEDSFEDLIDYYNLDVPYTIMNDKSTIIYELDNDIELFIQDSENIIFEDSFENLIDYYSLNKPYIIMNNNFAIIYKIGNSIKLVDIFANIDSKGNVLKQMKYALDQISNGKKIDIGLLNEKALNIYNQVTDKGITLKRKR